MSKKTLKKLSNIKTIMIKIKYNQCHIHGTRDRVKLELKIQFNQIIFLKEFG